MKIQNHLIILTLAGILVSCSNSAPTTRNNKLEKANWVIGEWQNNSPEGNFTENWVQQNDTIFSGEGFLVEGKDTVFSEAIQITQEGEELFYIPTIPNQNNGLPVRFKLTTSKDNELVFENPEHDFPQKITYTLINKDSMVAEISGVLNGAPKAEQFGMERVK